MSSTIRAAAVLIVLLGVSSARAQEETTSDAALCPGDATPASSSGSISSPASPDSSEPAGKSEAARGDRPYWRQNLFGRFFRDQKYLFTTWLPSELHRQGFTFPLLAGIVLATTSGATNGEGVDPEVQVQVQNETRGRAEGVAAAFSFIGNSAPGAVLIGTGYLVGRLSHNDRLAEASSLSAEAALSAGLWSSIVKAVTARSRPAGDTHGKFFNYNPAPGQTTGSFPSGHATGAFAVATAFSEVYKDHKWVAWVAYGTASLVGASRVAQGRHFPSDVIVGGLIGNSIGRMVVAHEHESGSAISTMRPFMDPASQAAGVVWARNW